MRGQRSHIVVALAMALASVRPIHAARAVTSTSALTSLGGPVLTNIKVMALAFGPDGVVYAGGRYVIPDRSPYANEPYRVGGSAFAISYDGGLHWDERVSQRSSIPTPLLSSPPWLNHAVWPTDFNTNSITIDPRNSHVIYVAGCTDGTEQCTGAYATHILLRSNDAGRTWSDAFTFREKPGTGRVITRAMITTNIKKTLLFMRVIQTAPPKQAFTLLFDRARAGRFYLTIGNLGILRSDDNAQTWTYTAQPAFPNTYTELVADPRAPHTLYALQRTGSIFRTVDGGDHWTLLTNLIMSVSNLAVVGHALYLIGSKTTASSLYRSIDGASWTSTRSSPYPNSLLAAGIRGGSAWLCAVRSTSLDSVRHPSMLYVAPDGSSWRRAAAIDINVGNGQGYSMLDFEAILGAGTDRMWENRRTRILYTSAPLGGVYRWTGGV